MGIIKHHAATVRYSAQCKVCKRIFHLEPMDHRIGQEIHTPSFLDVFVSPLCPNVCCEHDVTIEIGGERGEINIGHPLNRERLAARGITVEEPGS